MWLKSLRCESFARNEREEARYGFSAVCDDIVYSHKVGIEKPDPCMLELALARLGVRP